MTQLDMLVSSPVGVRVWVVLLLCVLLCAVLLCCRACGYGYVLYIIKRYLKSSAPFDNLFLTVGILNNLRAASSLCQMCEDFFCRF